MTSDTLSVLAASYDAVENALSDYEAIRIAHRHVGSSHDFDATVIAKNDAGKVAPGAVAGHASTGMSRDDLMRLGQALNQGDAGLVVMYASDMADQVATNVNRAGRTVRGTTRLTADQLAADIREADAPSAGAGGG
jgi:hypothetical protein